MTLQQKRFKTKETDVELVLTPNDEGGTRNAYLGIYDSEGHFIGSLDGKDLARFAKAIEPYRAADLEPALR